MKSDQLSLLELIEGKKIFQLPVYQRNYAWQETQVDRLLDDIENLLSNRQRHFFGVIVSMLEDEYLTLIDGQQRITTAMLFLKALADISEQEHYKILANDIVEKYLMTTIKKSKRVKLELLDVDQKNFLALIDDSRSLNQVKHNPIWQNYLLCKKRIQNWIRIDKHSPEKILHAFSKIQIVCLQLNPTEDDPQLIFESINSTGLELSTADLIRNFLLMGIKPRSEQIRMFNDYWRPIAEKNFRHDSALLNSFFMHLVTYKTDSTLVTQERIYSIFKQLYDGKNREGVFKEIKRFADFFEALTYDTGRYSKQIQKSINAMIKMKQTTCIPFLFHVFEDFEAGLIDEKTLEKIFHLLVSYYVITLVCGAVNKGRREFFIRLYARVFAVESNKSKYFESIKKFICTVDNRDRVPSNEDFASTLKNMELFKNKPLCRFILEDLAGIDEIDSRLKLITITPNRYEIGNLSLSKYNASNFSEFENLNENLDDIEARGDRLTRIFVERYSIDRNLDPTIVFDVKKPRSKRSFKL